MDFLEQEYPEGMIFMTSGIASAIYHNCDEHRHCVLQFRVLQVPEHIQLSPNLFPILMPNTVHFSSHLDASNMFCFRVLTVYGLLVVFLGRGEHFYVPNKCQSVHQKDCSYNSSNNYSPLGS